MWVWTLDEKLLNLNQVESIEVTRNYYYNEGDEIKEDDEAEPDWYEVVAFLPSNQEVSLLRTRDEGVAEYALELLAGQLGAKDLMEVFTQGEALDLSELVEESRKRIN